jgi:hypothetical protein
MKKKIRGQVLPSRENICAPSKEENLEIFLKWKKIRGGCVQPLRENCARLARRKI